MDHWSTLTSINDPLYQAATQGDMDLLNSALGDLSEGDELLHKETYKNSSVLHVAAIFGHCKIVQTLVQNCPSLVTKRNSKGDTPLHSAARDGHLSVVTFLIEYTNNVSSDVEEGNIEDVGEGLLKKKNLDGNTALHEAIKYKHESVACTLIEADQELLNLVNNNGESAFYLAAEAGLYELVAELLRLPIDHLLCEMKLRKSALLAAISRQHTGIIGLLLKEKSELLTLRDANGKGPLHYAFDFIHSDLAESDLLRGTVRLLEKEKPVLLTLRDANGRGPLHYIFDYIDPRQVVRRALRDANGRGLLHYIFDYIDPRQVVRRALRGCLVVNDLLRGDPSIAYHQDCDGAFPIHKAASHGFISGIEMILQHCPNSMWLLDHKGRNALHVAVASEENETVFFFLKRSGVLEELINETDVEGNTPLHLAVLEKNVAVMTELLCDNRVDTDAVNKEGLTPYDIAKHMYFDTEPSMREDLPFSVWVTFPVPRSYGRPLRKDVSMTQQRRIPMEKLKPKLETLLIVATLIITVTFAAGFTLPGGYKDDGPEEGMATMIRKATFHIFVITDSLALCSATYAAVVIVFAYIGELPLGGRVVESSFLLMGISLGMMILAFGSGLYVVLSKLKWLANVVLVMNAMSIVLSLPAFLYVLLPPVLSLVLLGVAHRQ